MNIKVNIKNSKIEDSNIVTGINGPVENMVADINDTEILRTQIFNNINVDEFCSKIEQSQAIVQMSSEEYAGLQAVLKARNDRKRFLDGLVKHLQSFAEGVLASIVANQIQG